MPVSRQELWSVLSEVVAEVLNENGFSGEEIVPTATLDELGITSIDTMHIMIMIEERLHQSLNFSEFVNQKGKFASDISLAELLEHLHEMMLSNSVAQSRTE